MFSLCPASPSQHSNEQREVPLSPQRGRSTSSDHSSNYLDSPRSASAASAEEYSPLRSPLDRTSFRNQWAISPSHTASPSNTSKNGNSPSHKALTEHHDLDVEADAEESLEIVQTLKPPTSLFNSSPYDFQLLSRLVPRHITIEHVVFSHRYV